MTTPVILTKKSLSGLTDVTINNPLNNEVLTYSGGIWKNMAVSGGTGGTGGSGTSGTSGSSGTRGTNGTNGSSGSSGTNGTNGISGSSGTNGTNGTNGISGSSGTNGTSGSSGSSGLSGVNGTSGSSGSSGTNGTNGTNGTSGSSGSSGTNGTSGSSGTNGTNGTNGTSGSSGSSGTNGTNGTNGTSGSSGSSGTNGTSGVGISNITFLLAVGTILTIGSNKARVIVPYVGIILKAYVSSGTGPQGSDAIFDIYKNGMSIWNITPSNRLKIVSGQTYGTQSSFDITSIVEGDILSIDVDQVGSTTPGGDISVQLKIQI